MDVTVIEGEGLFPAVSEADWRSLVEKALRGAPVERLATATEDGFALRPLEPAARAPAARAAGVEAAQGVALPADAAGVAGASGVVAAVCGRPTAVPWVRVQRIDVPRLAEANALARNDVAGGAGCLALVDWRAPTAYGAGIGLATIDDLAALLGGIDLAAVGLRVEAGGRWREAAALLAALCESGSVDPAATDIHFGCDPLGAAAAAGRLDAPWGEIGGRLANTAAALHARGFKKPIALADGRPWHAAGATDGQELAIVLAAAVECLRAFEAAGHDPTAMANAIGFALAVDQDQFGAIAKLRALRLAWAAVRAECGLADAPAHIHAETAWRMMTRRDPHTNIVRTTIAAFAAGVGGADAITVLPFSVALGVPDGFARRLARNTHAILIEEAHVAKVADPGAGSGAIEARTEALVGRAWELFRDIERRGGLAAAIIAGDVQSMVTAAHEARTAAVAGGRRPIVGVTRYRNPDENLVATLRAEPGAGAKPDEERGTDQEPKDAAPTAAPSTDTAAPSDAAAPADAADAAAATDFGEWVRAARAGEALARPAPGRPVSATAVTPLLPRRTTHDAENVPG